MINLFRDLDYILVYIDDIIIIGVGTHEEHMENASIVLEILENSTEEDSSHD